MRIVADANIPFVRECLSSVGDVQVLSGREITPSVVTNADALLVRSITPVNERLLGGSSVRFVGTATIGFDHVDVPYLEQNGIGFASAPGSNANSAAEYVIAGLLEIARRRQIPLEGTSIGVIGVGNVGSRVARKCEALGMRVLRNDPPLARSVPARASRSTGILPVNPDHGRDAHATTDAVYVPIEALYDCGFITIHTPLTREGPDKTYHLADAGFFGRLKPGAVFVNASRGAVVDSEALRTAIEAERLEAVVLDVWEGEPSIDVGLLERVDLGTPHIAGYSLDGKVAGMVMVYRSLCEHFKLPAKFDVKDFLPVPAVPRLEIETGETGDEELFARIVERIYSIAQDDRNMRQIANQPPQERGRFFDALRKNYPVRREFQNTTVALDPPRDSLARKLRGIGFVA